MQRRKILIVWIALVIGLMGLLALGSILILDRQRPYHVNQLQQMLLEGKKLEGKRVTVRGDAIFMPQSDFKFNALYLVNSGSEVDFRQPEYAFWFGIRIDDLSCSEDEDTWTCEPFDPSQAQAFELRGTLHSAQAGKKDILWLSGIDVARSRQLINGEWQPIRAGKFTIPLNRDY